MRPCIVLQLAADSNSNVRCPSLVVISDERYQRGCIRSGGSPHASCALNRTCSPQDARDPLVADRGLSPVRLRGTENRHKEFTSPLMPRGSDRWLRDGR